jgi:hypothetical protein
MKIKLFYYVIFLIAGLECTNVFGYSCTLNLTNSSTDSQTSTVIFNTVAYQADAVHTIPDHVTNGSGVLLANSTASINFSSYDNGSDNYVNLASRISFVDTSNKPICTILVRNVNTYENNCLSPNGSVSVDSGSCKVSASTNKICFGSGTCS